MRILAVSTWLPYPPDTGFRIRAFNLLRHLSERHEITLVSFSGHESESRHLVTLEQFCQRVVVVRHDPFARRPARSMIGFLSPQPRFLFAGYSPRMRRAVDELCSSEPFDLILSLVIVATHHTRNVSRVPQILDLLEVTQLVQDPDGQALPTSLKRQLANQKLALYVRKLLECGIVCTTASNAEKMAVMRLVGDCPSAPIEVVPNGVDCRMYQDVVPVVEAQPYLVFTGALTFGANLEAAAFFLKSVWPIIHNRKPRLRMKITGPYEGVRLDYLPLTPEITLTGYVEDIRPVVAGAAACVVPILTGGGTRLKVLEAMAIGVPVVSTSKGAEGLDVRHEEHLLVADEPVLFANEVMRVLDDISLRDRLVTSAQHLVQDKYNWDRIGCVFEELIQRVTSDA